MHELSIIQSLIPQIEEYITGNKCKKVNKIYLEVGVMSGVIADALEFAYDICSKGTKIEGAELLIKTVPVTASCKQCHSEFEVQNYCFSCPQCTGTELDMISGNELRIKHIEVEED
jgi:hydrogenase nickel incorporation protein HypA/HybF